MIVDQYIVHADALAGICLDAAVYVGKVDLFEWLDKQNSAEYSHCTSDVDGEVRAIKIIWQPQA